MVRTLARMTLLATAVWFAAPGGAMAADWTVAKVSGPVWFGSDAVQKAALATGATISSGTRITVGSGGRVMLTRGEDVVLAGPGSLIELPEDAAAGVTGIVQRLGEAFYTVDKGKYRQFTVSTPYLAAIVKGTQFTVAVTRTGANVSVSEGRVEVYDYSTGSSRMLVPGHALRDGTADDGASGAAQGTGSGAGSAAASPESTGGSGGVVSGLVSNLTSGAVGETLGETVGDVQALASTAVGTATGITTGVANRLLGGESGGSTGGGSGKSSGKSSGGDSASGGGSSSSSSSGSGSGGSGSSGSSASASSSSGGGSGAGSASSGGSVRDTTRKVKKTLGKLL